MDVDRVVTDLVSAGIDSTAARALAADLEVLRFTSDAIVNAVDAAIVARVPVDRLERAVRDLLEGRPLAPRPSAIAGRGERRHQPGGLHPDLFAKWKGTP